MQLSEHFTLAELCVTQTGLPNRPPGAMTQRLRETAFQMEKVRCLLGNQPIRVLSGYRSAQVNAAVGGSPTSAHLTGFAVDFTCDDYASPRAIVQTLREVVRFDQLIWEHPPASMEWVHISFDPRGRQQVLEYPGHGIYLRLP